MESRYSFSSNRARPVVPCAQCGEALFAARWAEYLDDRRIRYLWSCEACGYEFESEARYPASVVPRRASGPPKLRLIE
jgi:hypothetical protein